jgi:hypothetical protein
MDFGKNGKRHSTQKANDPQSRNDSHGTLQTRHRIEMEWMTNGKESLHGECDDCEHRNVG